VSVPMTLSDPGFKATVQLQVEYLKTVHLREKSYYKTLIGNHI